MATEITMPKFGQTMESGSIVAWRKGVGDYIEKGEVFLQIETDKATLDVEAEHSGCLSKILVPAGEEEIPCGQVIGYLGEQA